MIEDVEELRAEAQAQMLGEVKLALECDIGLGSSKTAKNIPSEVALLPDGRHRKSRLIEDFPAGILRSIENWRHTWY